MSLIFSSFRCGRRHVLDQGVCARYSATKLRVGTAGAPQRLSGGGQLTAGATVQSPSVLCMGADPGSCEPRGCAGARAAPRLLCTASQRTRPRDRPTAAERGLTGLPSSLLSKTQAARGCSFFMSWFSPDAAEKILTHHGPSDGLESSFCRPASPPELWTRRAPHTDLPVPICPQHTFIVSV